MDNRIVRRTTLAAAISILSACGAPNAAHDERAAPTTFKSELAAQPDARLESIEPSPVKVRTTAAPTVAKPTQEAARSDPQPTGSYHKAVDCAARLTVVNILVQSDVIVQPDIVRFAGRGQGYWQDRATTLGRGQGLSARLVQADVDRRHLFLIDPVINGRPSDVAPLLQSLVRQGSTCEF